MPAVQQKNEVRFAGGSDGVIVALEVGIIVGGGTPGGMW
jgi:hypothetical protein